MSNTAATLDATWKEVYANGVSNVIPKSRILLREIPFDESEKVGDKFVQPVALTQEHGVTYLGQRYGVDDLETAQAAIYAEAQVDGHGMLLRSQISYNVADKMAGSKQAFGQWSSLIVGNMMDSMTKRQELGMLYGQVGLGIISGVSGSGGTRTWTLTAASWADGIWAGMENARLDVFETVGSAARRNTNAAVTITSVNFANRQLVVAGNSTDLSAIVANDNLFFRNSNSGSNVFKEAPGLQRIATNSGSLFNINAGTYGLWRGVTSSSGSAALTLSKVLGGVAAAAGRGLEEDLMVLLNPYTFRDMASDQAALKRHGGESKTAKNGYQYLEFFAQNGTLKVAPHIYVKGGDAFGMPVPAMKRVGATDTTYNLEGDGMGRVFLHIPDKAGFELRCRSEFSIYCEKPAQLIYWNDIVNS
jgi:hypothetical protein